MQRKNILWIDDEIEFFRAHIMFLEARGYSVTPLYSGYDGLSALHKNHNLYDIVLLDEQMPGKDGLSVLGEIKEFLPDLPVVMVTKSEEEDLMERAIGKKIDGYLTKPVNPSQILMICKNLLCSQEILSDHVKNAFVKSYSEIESKLKNNLSYKEWVKIYQKITKREFDAEGIRDEAFRQKHFSQKIEANELFADFFMQNYPLWIKNPESNGKPALLTEIMKRFVLPELEKNTKIALIILDSFHLDQFVIVQRLLKKIFQFSQAHFCSSIVPTTIPHALSALLTGLLPKDFADERPDLWNSLSENGTGIWKSVAKFGSQRYSESVWKDVAKFGAQKLGYKKNVLFYNILKENANPHLIISQISHKQNFGIIFANFLELVSPNKQNKLMKNIISDSKMFLEMTSAWFEKSGLYELLKLAAKENIKVILTASGGNILCTSPTELYGKHSGYSNSRFRCGELMSSDMRTGYYVTSPDEYGLPVKAESTSFNILCGNYYFVEHGNYSEISKKQLNFFDRGGVSLEEAIVPLVILSPKQDEN